MNDEKVYEVVVTREDGVWLGDVPSVPGAHTFARSLAGLVEAVREVIVLMDDLPDDAKPTVTFSYVVPDEVITSAAEVGRQRAKLDRAERENAAATAAAVHRLKAAGYSVRDASVLLGVTPGRVSQLTAGRADGERGVRKPLRAS